MPIRKHPQPGSSAALRLVPAARPTDGAEVDVEAVRDLQMGNAQAREALYRRHFAAVFRTALRLLENRADAEDVVQDAFVSAFAEIGKLRDPTAFESWILGIAVHRAHRHFRRRRWLRAIGLGQEDDPVTLDQLACEDADPAVREALAIVDRELRKLPPRKRAAWVLRHVEGHTLEETAAACDCSLATVKRWIRLASKRIAPYIDLELRETSRGTSEVSDES